MWPPTYSRFLPPHWDPLTMTLARLRLGPPSSVVGLAGSPARRWGSVWCTTAGVAVEVCHGDAAGDDVGHPGWAREPGYRVSGSDLLQRVCAESAGRRAGGAVPGGAGVPDPVAGCGEPDRRTVPRRGAPVRRGQPDPGGALRQGDRKIDVMRPAPGPAGRDRPVRGGGDRGGAGVPTGGHLQRAAGLATAAPRTLAGI